MPERLRQTPTVARNMDYSGRITPSLAPYDSSGNLLRCPSKSTSGVRGVPDWRLNVPFTAILRIAGWVDGRVGGHFVWISSVGRRYPMFGKDMADFVQAAPIISGTARGTWIVVQAGVCFGLRKYTKEERGV